MRMANKFALTDDKKKGKGHKKYERSIDAMNKFIPSLSQDR